MGGLEQLVGSVEGERDVGYGSGRGGGFDRERACEDGGQCGYRRSGEADTMQGRDEAVQDVQKRRCRGTMVNGRVLPQVQSMLALACHMQQNS